MTRYFFAIFVSLVSVLAQNGVVPAPAFTYSTYLRDNFLPSAVATDFAGNVYIAGTAIIDPDTSQTAAMVVKLVPTADRYNYVRVIGGSSNEIANGIAVDGAGNAYITGTATSPDFPVTPGRQLATPPTDANNTRTFLTKLDTQGSVVFSELLGGSVRNAGQAVAVNAQGEILVSGTGLPGFPVTAGAFNMGSTGLRPYLMKLDPTGASVKFAAFGIGGSALATDASGNIYMAGATTLLDYPTTAGSYQPVLKLVTICFGLCQIAFAGTNQYLTKVDANGANLIYSTGVAGFGQTSNNGLAVDSAGNAYLTGLSYAGYPYTVKDPMSPQVRPFLTKIDAAGKTAIYSIPVGGAGVALDAKGNMFVGGTYDNQNLFFGLPFPFAPPPLPLGVATPPPAVCRINGVITGSQAYVSELDATTGDVKLTLLADSSALTAQSIALVGSNAWIVGTTLQPDVPITGGALVPASLPRGYDRGAFLGMANLSIVASPDAPQLACILDAANGTRAGAVAPNQLLSIFGTNLGPAQGAGAPDSTTTLLGGVSVFFDGVPASVLYSSASQINVAVPLAAGNRRYTQMQVKVNGAVTAARNLPVTLSAPSMFANLSSVQSCTGAAVSPPYFAPVAIHEDGSLNSCANPAKPGSIVSFFLNGLGGQLDGNGNVIPAFGPAVPLLAKINNLSAEVVRVETAGDFVYRADVRIPSGRLNPAPSSNRVLFYLAVTNSVFPVGPLAIGTPSLPLDLMLWVGP